jgi:hypothetical protein
MVAFMFDRLAARTRVLEDYTFGVVIAALLTWRAKAALERER